LLRLAIGLLCGIVFGPAVVRIVRGYKSLRNPDDAILLYRMWEGQ
jgi:hypothetical protein